MASLLIIGGSGFFGKSVLNSFSKGQLEKFDIHKVSILARNAGVLRKQVPHLLPKNVLLFNADIKTCSEIPVSDYVIHAAASTDEKSYLSNPNIERQNILAGALNFCRLAPKYCRNSKIIFVSSGAVYGQQTNEQKGLEEDSLLVPIDTLTVSKRNYALAKRESEQAIILLGSQGLSVSIARCFAFVGEYLPRDRSFAMGNFIEDGLHNRPIVVKAQNKVTRSYLDADDLVEWLMLIGLVAASTCPIFNVGSDEEVSIQALALKIAKIFNVPHQIPEITIPFVDRYVPSIEKAKSIGCNIENPLKFSIEKMIAAVSKT